MYTSVSAVPTQEFEPTIPPLRLPDFERRPIRTVALARTLNWDTTMMQILSVLHAPYISARVRRVVILITDSRQSPVYVESVCKYLSGSNYAKEFAYRLVAQPLAERDEQETENAVPTWIEATVRDDHAGVPLLGVLATRGMPSLLFGRKTT
jgi:hypothetical protein